MDVQTISSGWLNLYTASGLAVGVGIEVQNKSSSNLVTIQESATQPSSDNYAGRILRYCDVVEIWTGSPGVWVRGVTNSIWLNVQEVPA